jgi:hypothetical protein
VDGNSRLVSGDVGEVLARLRAEFPGLEKPVSLRLAETRRFDSGVIYLGYVPA